MPRCNCHRTPIRCAGCAERRYGRQSDGRHTLSLQREVAAMIGFVLHVRDAMTERMNPSPPSLSRIVGMIDALIILSILALLILASGGSRPERSTAGRIADIDKSFPPAAMDKITVACNATPNTCGALPPCGAGGRGGQSGNNRAMCADIRLSYPGLVALPLSAVPEGEAPPEKDRKQADHDEAKNLCAAFPKRPPDDSSRNALCAYLSKAMAYSGTCMNAYRAWRDQPGKRAKEIRTGHTRVQNLKAEHVLKCGAPRKIIGFRHISEEDPMIFQRANPLQDRDWVDF